jgi:WD40 repeat protein
MGEYKVDCAFSNDGAFALSGSEDGDVVYWDLVRGSPARFHAHGKALRALAYHPEEAMLVTACIAGSVKVWSR